MLHARQNSSREKGPKGLLAKLISGIAVIAMSVGLVAAGSATAANAATGVTVQVMHNGSPIQENAEVRTGDNLKLQLTYNSTAVGQVVEIKMGAGVSIAGPFPANEAVQSIVPNDTGDGVIVTFKDPWPTGVAQGILDLDFDMVPVDESAPGKITWSDGDDSGSTDVIFIKDGDSHENVGDGFAKDVTAGGNLSNFVNTDVDGNYLGLKPGIESQLITYTLTVNTPAGASRGALAISDLLPTGLGYVQPLTVTGTETTWDENGYNPSSAPRAFTVLDETVNSFDGVVGGTLTGPSVLKLTYQVQVTDPTALDTALQAAFTAKNGAPGDYGIWLTNTATFDGDSTDDASVYLGGRILGPGAGQAFGKSGDLGTVNLPTGTTGALDPAIDINYTLRANLQQWDRHSGNFELNSNVVITDNLLPQASWNFSGDLPVNGLYDNSGNPIANLTNAGTCPATAADFGADANVGKYCFDGNKLMVNVGKYHNGNAADPVYTNATIVAPAKLNTVADLPTEGSVDGGDRLRVRNTATFTWGSSSHGTGNTDGYVVVPDADNSSGVNDSSAFAKTAPSSVNATPNAATEVTYTFKVDTARTGTPAANTRIVDYVDPRFFDVAADLSNVTVTGNYAGTGLAQGDFDLAFVAGANGQPGELSIQLNATGAAKATAAGGKLEVYLTLTTRVFDGKETIDLVNRADLFGEGDNPLFWSSFESQATSFGAEAETRKHVYDPISNGGEWASLYAPGEAFDADKIYVYRLQFIGHNGFGNTAITTEKDVLPAGLEFIGFVTEENKATGADASLDPVDVSGNLVASFDEAEGVRGTISLSQKPGTTFTSGATANVYFAAKVTDPNQLIVNSFGDSSTTIVPDLPSIDIEKWTADGEGSGPAYDENGELLRDGYDGDHDEAPGKPLEAGATQQINFTVSNNGPEPLVDIVVSDELTDGKGTIADLVCTFVPAGDGVDEVTGTEWAGPLAPGERFECTGTLPALESGDTHADTASVTGAGQFSGVPVEDADDWNGYVPVPSIDIEKWIDEGASPEYDESGVLLNDGFKGDYDKAPGKQLTADKSEKIRFTVSNDGEEPLVNIVVSDELTSGTGKISDLVCTFVPASTDGEGTIEAVTGTEWAGPLYVGEQFECEGTLPALKPGQKHSDTAKVTAVGMYSGTDVDDEDDWHGNVPAALVNTGGQSLLGLALLGGLGLLGGGLLLLRRRAAKA